MSKERELLRRALDHFGFDYYGRTDKLAQEIRAHLAAEEGKQDPFADSIPRGVEPFTVEEGKLSVKGCTRSHPHDDMDYVCDLKTEIARLMNENARLKGKQKEHTHEWVGVGLRPSHWRCIHCGAYELDEKPSCPQNVETATRSEGVVAEATDQEPVAWNWWYSPTTKTVSEVKTSHHTIQLRTPSPQADQRKPLSEEEIGLYVKEHRSPSFEAAFILGVRWAERMHGIGGNDE